MYLKITMKIFKLFLIIGFALIVSGCILSENAAVYPEPEPSGVIWINGMPYYYVDPGIYYRVYIRDGNYRYLGTPPHVTIPLYPEQRRPAHPHIDGHHGNGYHAPPHFHSHGRR
jgi:hypothetical protein